jgi:hypothetical protein
MGTWGDGDINPPETVGADRSRNSRKTSRATRDSVCFYATNIGPCKVARMCQNACSSRHFAATVGIGDPPVNRQVEGSNPSRGGSSGITLYPQRLARNRLLSPTPPKLKMAQLSPFLRSGTRGGRLTRVSSRRAMKPVPIGANQYGRVGGRRRVTTGCGVPPTPTTIKPPGATRDVTPGYHRFEPEKRIG